MKLLLTPAMAGISAVRHLAWYVGYQTAGSRHHIVR
jgi:hypothetical protein